MSSNTNGRGSASRGRSGSGRGGAGSGSLGGRTTSPTAGVQVPGSGRLSTGGQQVRSQPAARGSGAHLLRFTQPTSGGQRGRGQSASRGPPRGVWCLPTSTSAPFLTPQHSTREAGHEQERAQNQPRRPSSAGDSAPSSAVAGPVRPQQSPVLTGARLREVQRREGLGAHWQGLYDDVRAAIANSVRDEASDPKSSDDRDVDEALTEIDRETGEPTRPMDGPDAPFEDYEVVQRAAAFLNLARPRPTARVAILWLTGALWDVDAALEGYHGRVQQLINLANPGMTPHQAVDFLEDNGFDVEIASDAWVAHNLVADQPSLSSLSLSRQAPTSAALTRRTSPPAIPSKELNNKDEAVKVAQAEEMAKLNPKADRKEVKKGQGDATKLTITLVHPDGKMKSVTYKHPVDWNNADHVHKLNKWRAQHFRRHLGQVQEFRVPFLPEEIEWLERFHEQWRRTREMGGRQVNWNTMNWEDLARTYNQVHEGQIYAGSHHRRPYRSATALRSESSRIRSITDLTGRAPKDYNKNKKDANDDKRGKGGGKSGEYKKPPKEG